MTGEKMRQFVLTSPIQGANGAWVEAMYEQFLEDPDSVEDSWKAYFTDLADNATADTPHSPVVKAFEALGRQGPRRATGGGGDFDAAAAAKQGQVLRLINYYRVRGHQAARLDPLGLADQREVPDLDPGFHNLDESDLDTVFNTGSLATAEQLTLREIIDIVKTVYTGTIGAEYMYINDTPQKRWIQARLEGTVYQQRLDADEKKNLLLQLTAAEGLERYMHTRYVGQKRFSLEGGDSLIPAMDTLIRQATGNGVEEVVIGMAHRGRLNVLVNILGKSPKDLFEEFEGKIDASDARHSGDVKYHKGFSSDIEVDGRRVHMVLAFNPSHLEIVNPVVEGSVKCRQHRRGDDTGDTILPVLIHGDAAFAGQGVVMETMQLSQAKGYATGGTVHIIVNNQVGFTTDNPIETELRQNARTSLYCTDLAKMLESPVFHVNADDPEAVVFVTKLAMDYRAKFHKDVIIDLICYRRHGHNEADEPMVTQPQMYQVIKKHPTTRALYAEQLLKEGVIDEDHAESLQEQYRAGLDEGENTARNTLGMVGNQHTVDWSRYINGSWDDTAETAVDSKILARLADTLLDVPDDFKLHNRIDRVMKDRRKMADGELPLDWGMAETLAYASLIDEGFQVRLSGQDAGRGTFFHRQARLLNQNDGSIRIPLETIKSKREFVVNDTLLSEEGVLGFEYGFATAVPDTLVIWEAQFGDFANGAQVVVDQFISSGHAKWGRLCGLVMFLPHGYEGQGPEHSSARLERYLQLCAGDNMQVCVPSTPSQFFHMIRRQMKRDYKLPLIVMTPKSLLRHKQSVSSLDELATGEFRTLIFDRTKRKSNADVKRVVLCSGKVYFDLHAKRAELEREHDVALVRIEQLYPFPRADYAKMLDTYKNATEVVWCQEEPENQGAWYQIKHRLQVPLDEQHTMMYATRAGSPSTATGFASVHAQEQEALVQKAIEGGDTVKGG